MENIEDFEVKDATRCEIEPHNLMSPVLHPLGGGLMDL